MVLEFASTLGVERATELLVESGAELLLHLGDIGGTDVIDAMLVARRHARVAIGPPLLNPAVYLLDGHWPVFLLVPRNDFELAHAKKENQTPTRPAWPG